MNIASFTTIAKFVQAGCMQLHGYNKCWNGPIGLLADAQEYWIGREVHQVSTKTEYQEPTGTNEDANIQRTKANISFYIGDFLGPGYWLGKPSN